MRIARLVVASTVLTVACDAPVTRVESSSVAQRRSLRATGIDVAIPSFPEPKEVLPEKRIEADVQSFDRVVSDEALVAAVRRANGIVIVGLKPSSAEPTRITRRIPAITRAEILEGRDELTKRGAVLIRSYRHIAAVVARIDPERAPELRQLPVVNYISPQRVGFSTSPPVALRAKSPRLIPYPDQDTSWGVHKIGADSVWTTWANYGSYSTVTILDFGLIENQWQNSSLDGPQNLVNCMYVEAAASTCWNYVGHGSFVGGVVNARDNELGYIGIARGLYEFNSVRIFTTAGVTTTDVVAAALDWAIDLSRSRHIVNMSIQFCEDDETLADAIANAASSGILLVASAGNIDPETPKCDGDPPGTTGVTYPARYSQVIAVSGTMANDGFAYTNTSPCTLGSRSGSQVLLSAPFWAYSITGHDTWGMECGTSFAAPVVSAVAALIWSANTSWSATNVRSRLIETAADLGTSGKDDQFGWGRISAMQAVSINPTATITGKTSVKPNVTCGWTAEHTLPLPPYTYYWWKNSTSVGTNSSLLSINTGTSSFTLEVVVVNAAGSAVWDSHSVTVTSGASVCSF